MSKWGWTINKMGDMGMAQAISAPMDPHFYMLVILSVAIGHRRHSNLVVAIAPFPSIGIEGLWDWPQKGMKSQNLVVAPTARGDPKAFSSWRRHAGGVGGQVRPQVGASMPPDFFVGFITSSHFQGVSLPFWCVVEAYMCFWYGSGESTCAQCTTL